MLLELNDYEALALSMFMRKISGDTETSIRKYADSINNKLKVSSDFTSTVPFIRLVSGTFTCDDTLDEFNKLVDDRKTSSPSKFPITFNITVNDEKELVFLLGTVNTYTQSRINALHNLPVKKGYIKPFPELQRDLFEVVNNAAEYANIFN